MNLIEKVIKKTEAELKEMTENPSPTQLHSDVLGVELDLIQLKAQLETWEQGRPFMFENSSTLARAMGCEPIVYPTILLRCPEEADGVALTTIRELGIPGHACDHVITLVGAVVAGLLPPPSVMLTSHVECSTMAYPFKVFADKLNVPSYELDPPLRYNEENIRYLADQLVGFIEYAESKVPGIKYDRDKHLEIIENERKAYKYVRKLWELKKRVPFPESNASSLLDPTWSWFRLPSNYVDPTKSLEYWRVRIEELEERADKMSAEDKERQKLRVLWVWNPPAYIETSELIELLDSRGVVVTDDFMGPSPFFSGRHPAFGDEEEFGRKLSPLEETARTQLGFCWRSEGFNWVDEIVWECQETNCDAVIITQLTDCQITSSLSKLIADTAEKKLGIQSVIIPGETYEAAIMPPSEFKSRLTEFIDMALAEKRAVTK